MSGSDPAGKRRVLLRGVMIAVGYVIYLIVDASQPIFTSACVGLGVVLFGLAEIDSRTLPSKDRSRMMEVGLKILGLGLIGLGLYLVLR